MTIAGGLFAFTDAAMVWLRPLLVVLLRPTIRVVMPQFCCFPPQELNNVDSEIKRGAASGCVAGFTYGIHRSSLSSAFLGCAVLGGAVGGYEL